MRAQDAAMRKRDRGETEERGERGERGEGERRERKERRELLPPPGQGCRQRGGVKIVRSVVCIWRRKRMSSLMIMVAG